MAWYSRRQWELLKQVADDAETMDDTYSQWESNTQNAFRILRQSGYPVEIVDVDVAELINWAKSARRPIDGEARSEFVLEKTNQGRPKKKSLQNLPETPFGKKSENK